MTSKDIDEEVIFSAARKIDSPQDRLQFIRRACGDDVALVARIHALLEAWQQDAGLPELLPPEIAEIYRPIALESVGAEIGPYKLLEQIGEGGFGLVYVAEQRQPLVRRVALKVIKPGMDTRDVITRFEVERQALAMMDHPNIARVFDAGATDSGRPYFVMELVRGVPITEFCDCNRLTLRERLELFIPVCHAVQHAHQKGIIHRDIKPTNVLVTLHDGRPVIKVIDFGVAKAIGGQLNGRQVYTRFTQMIGTPLYMSPEQAEMGGLDIDTRTDIYSLGVLLYELLTGSTPHDRDRLAASAHDEVRRIIQKEDPPTPSTRLFRSGQSLKRIAIERKSEPAKLSKYVRGDLDWIVMKSLEKDRSRRYETADGLAQDVQRFLGDQPVEASPPSTGYRLRRFIRRNRTLLATGGAFLAVLLLGAIISTWQAVRLSRESAVALSNLNRAQNAEKSANERLFKSSLAQARAIRLTGHVGQRFEGLKALGQAATAVHSLPHDESITRNLRDETIACLALPDLQVDREWSVQTAFLGSDVFDHALTRYTACDAEGGITLFQVTDRLKLLSLPGVGRRLQTMWPQFSPNGRYLAVQYWFEDRTVESVVWDLEASGEGKKIVLGEHVQCMAFSPDSRQIAGTWPDNSLRTFSLADRTTRLVLSNTNATHLVYRPDGQELAMTLFERDDLKIVELEHNQIVASLVHPAELLSVAWSPDGRLLAVGCDDRKTYIWDTTTGRQQSTLTGHQKQVYVLSFNPASDILTTSSSDGTTCLWDPISGRRLVTGIGWCSGFSADGQRLGFHDNEKISVWNLADGSECRRLHPARVGNAGPWNPFKGPVSPDYSPDGRWLVCAGFDGVRIWETITYTEVAYLPIGHQEVSFFHPTGKQLFTYGRNGLNRWPIRDVGRRQQDGVLFGPPQIMPLESGWDWDYRACVSGDGRVLAAADPTRGEVTILDLDTPERQLRIENCNQIISLALSVDGRYLATGYRNRSIDLWEATTGKPMDALRLPSGDSNAASMVFSPDGQLFVVSIRGAISTWKVSSWEPGPIASGKRSDVWTGPPTFTPDGRLMAAVNATQFVTLYDVASATELATLTPADPQNLCAPSFSPDGALLAVGAEDHTLQIWDIRRLRGELRELELDWDLPAYPVVAANQAKTPPIVVAHGLVEAECLEVVNHGHCEYTVEDMRPLRPKRWSSRKQLLCRTEPGGFVEIELPVATAGQYQLEVGLTKGPSYGLVQLRLDGMPIGEAIDAFASEIAPMGAMRIGFADLRPGPHRIGFAVVEKSPQATGYDIGIDTLKLSPVEPDFH